MLPQQSDCQKQDLDKEATLYLKRKGSNLISDIPDETTIGETTKKVAQYYFNQIVNLLYDTEQLQQIQLKKQTIIFRLVELGYDEERYLPLIQQFENQLLTLSTEDIIMQILQIIDGDEEISKQSPIFYNQGFALQTDKVSRISIQDDIPVERKFTFGNPASQKLSSNMKKRLSTSDVLHQAEIKLQQKLKTCDICCHDKQEDKFYIRSSCSHTICQTCILEYVNFKIDNSQVENIKCFNSLCTECFSQEEIIQILVGNDAKIEKYHRILSRNIIMQNPNNKFCTKPDCIGFITIDPNSSSQYQTCNMCGTEICVKCFNQWHPRVSCSQNIEKSIQRYLEQNLVQLCPKCKIKIEKMTGCNHITCSFCQYEWCWLCKSKYSRSHFEQFNPLGCPGFYKSKEEWPMFKIYIYRILCVLFWIFYSASIPILFYFYVSSRYGLLFMKGKRNTTGFKKVIFYTIGIIWFLLGPALFPIHLAHYMYTIIAKNCKCCIKKKITIEQHRPRNSALFNLSEQRSFHQFRPIIQIQRGSIRNVNSGTNNGSNNNFDQRQIPNGSKILCRLQRSPYHVNRPYLSKINKNNLQVFDENKEELQDSPQPNYTVYSPFKVNNINIPHYTQSPQKLSKKNILIELHSAGQKDSANSRQKPAIKRERKRPSSLIGIRSIKSMDFKNQKFGNLENNVKKVLPSVRSSQTLELKQQI